jgi:hypothetical protein
VFVPLDNVKRLDPVPQSNASSHGHGKGECENPNVLHSHTAQIAALPWPNEPFTWNDPVNQDAVALFSSVGGKSL